MPTNINEVTRAYIAGFIDGEGCITITKSKKRRTSSYCYALNVVISNTNLESLELVQRYYGGKIVKLQVHSIWVDRYALRIGTHKSHMLIKDLTGYFIVKRKQARVALIFMDIKKKYGGRLGKRCDESFLQKEEDCKLNMNKLNKRGK